MSKWLPLHHRTKLRKWTSVVHVVAGIFCGILYHWYPGLSITLFVGFGVYEWWENSDGRKDFWEGLLGYFIGAGIMLILKLWGVI